MTIVITVVVDIAAMGINVDSFCESACGCCERQHVLLSRNDFAGC